MNNEKEKAIRASITRMVTHLAREHQVKQDVIWQQMYYAAASEIIKEK